MARRGGVGSEVLARPVLVGLVLVGLVLGAGCAANDRRDGGATTTSTPLTGVDERPPCPTSPAATPASDPFAVPEPSSDTGPRFVDATCAAGLFVSEVPVSDPRDCLVGPRELAARFPEHADAVADLDTRYGGFCQWERFSGGVMIGDVDGDDAPDVFVPRLTESGRLFRNDGRGRFDDVTAASGLAAMDSGSVGAAFADVDGDQDLDLAVAGLGWRGSQLWMNDGQGRFREQGADRGVAGDDGSVHLGFSVAPGDIDGDGFVDLYFTEYAARPESFPFPRARSRLLRNRGVDAPGYFVDVTEAAGVDSLDPEGTWAFAATLRDLDRDGHVDLAVTRDFGTSATYWGVGDGTFTAADDDSGLHTEGNGMGATTFDLDGDGDPDRVVTSIYDARGSSLTTGGNWVGTGNRVFRNDGRRRFRDVTDELGMRDGQWGWGIAAFDATNSGGFDLVQTSGIDAPDLDLLAPFRAGPMRLWPTGADPRRDAAFAAGLTMTNARGLAVADIDGDGRVDVLVARPGSSPVLYRNVSAAGHHLRVAVRARHDRDALHAVVVVTTVDGRRHVTEVQSVTDFLGQSERVVHVGLGDTTEVVSVEVEFPSGRAVTVADPDIDTTITVVEP